MLIVCGSAASWIVDKLLESKGGFYDRVTRIIDLQPFTLSECPEFYREKGIVYTDRPIVECYMIFGGISSYIDLLSTVKSLA